MVASIINGRLLANEILDNLKSLTQNHVNQGLRAPSLAVILVGNDKASSIYVNSKQKACEAIGYKSYLYNIPHDTEEDYLVTLVQQLNQADFIDGILVQLPLPKHINAMHIIEVIDKNKDVDGFHPYNLGRLITANPNLRPCTPYGIIQLLKYYQIPLASKHAVIIGKSNIVGKPLALELILENATVTICHSKTTNLKDYIENADIVISATGVYGLIDTNWLKCHQVVIDVGIHRDSNNKVHGDIDFRNAQKKVAWITPVPNGVGPMTIATLFTKYLSNLE